MKPSARERHRERGGPPTLPALTPFDDDALEPDRDYDGVDIADLDLSGQDAADCRFLECRLVRCNLDGLSMRRARIVGSVLAEVRGASVDVADSTWRDTHLEGSRIGALSLAGATLAGVRVRGCKLGFVGLVDAHLDDVVFEGCEIGGVDARGAGLRSVSFVACTVDELNVTGATLAKVDLSGARLRSLIGVESLRGAIVSLQQLHDLAPVLAAQLGLEVIDDEPGEPGGGPGADRRG